MKLVVWFLNRFYALICLLGFIWQITEVSIIYFNYDVVTRVATDVPDTFQFPTLHTCYRYTDVLNYDKMNQELKTNWSFSSYDGPAIQKLQHDLNVKNIHDFTPSIEDSIESCRSKHPKSYLTPSYNRSECQKIFNVSKYVALEYICYKYDFVPEEKFTLLKLALTVRSPGMMYEIVPGPGFEMFMVSKIIITSPKAFPHKAMGLTPVFERRDLDIFGIYVTNFFTLIKESLPSPFKTNCMNYMLMNRANKVDCQLQCLKKFTLETFNKIPFSIIQKEIIPIYIISYQDVKNDTISKLLFEFDEICSKVCKRIDCWQINSFTRVDIEAGKGYQSNRNQFLSEFSKYKIRVNTPIEPSYRVVFVPSLQLAEYITYLLSTFGIWFGMTIYGLNPIKHSKSIYLEIIKLVKGNKPDLAPEPTMNNNELIQLKQSMNILKLEMRNMKRQFLLVKLELAEITI